MNDNEEFILKLHNGETVETIEMGGISESYENAIQGLFVDMLLIVHKKQIPSNAKEVNELLTHVANTCTSKLEYGYSGAQVGAAKSLCWFFLADGYKGAIEKMRQINNNRIIKINKYGLINYKENETTKKR